jgi:peptidoglycan/xylan/chitin deacetylase (PgdA/CDA1 family)
MITPNFWKAAKANFFSKDLFFVTTPWWLRKLFTGRTWDISSKEKIIYLTFDDGPHPVITPAVLTELNKYEAKATFFCIGDNVKKFPGIHQQVISEGHAVGNHTMHHINGWNTADSAYTDDIAAAQKYIDSNLFRPPYGRLKNSQLREIKQRWPHLKTIMWSVLAGDWVTTLDKEQCFQQVRNAVYPGCIIVLHDSEKANQRMSYVLPKLLQYFTEKGYKFKKIEL